MVSAAAWRHSVSPLKTGPMRLISDANPHEIIRIRSDFESRCILIWQVANSGFRSADYCETGTNTVLSVSILIVRHWNAVTSNFRAGKQLSVDVIVRAFVCVWQGEIHDIVWRVEGEARWGRLRLQQQRWHTPRRLQLDKTVPRTKHAINNLVESANILF